MARAVGLDVPTIVATALAIADAEGIEKLTMRRVSPALNVTPMALYHHEPYQEGLLVLDGEALLIIEGEEHPLKQWDYVHCPRDVPHVILGAGDRDALVLAVGSRVGPDGGTYPVDETAIKHGAGRTDEANSPRDEYAKFGAPVEQAYPGDILPG